MLSMYLNIVNIKIYHYLPLDKKYYQYTIIDEASRERFIYFFDEYNQFNTTQFLMMAIKCYGYIPNIIQTDNGPEFTSRNWHKVKKDSLFTDTWKLHNILHKTIRTRTPRHNGRLNVLIVMITTDFMNS